MRLVMFFSIPVLEDDSYRYFWDGAVSARGVDPYKYAPAEFHQTALFDEAENTARSQDFEELKRLADTHPEPYSRINFPYVSTIYPPFAQAAFVVAHWIDPFGITGWRLVLLLTDVVALVLLLSLLKAFNRSAIWISLYWWNPVVIVQGFGAGHMDLLLLPFLLAALLFAHSHRTGLASLALAGGVAVKIWPILLFPFLLRPYGKQPFKTLLYALIFTISISLVMLPQALHAFAPEAGINAYTSDWRTHAFLFSILEDLILAPLSDPGQASRVTVAAIMIALVAVLALQFGDRITRLPSLWAAVIAALIFLSPTGYPWYLIWLAPLLSFLPQSGLVALFALAPLYWLRFQFGDHSPVYQWGVVPIAFGVPLALITVPYLKGRFHDAICHHHSRFE